MQYFIIVYFAFIFNCRPQTEISSQLLTTGNSITLSHLIDTATFTNSVLSESRQSAGSETVDVSFKSRAVSHGMQMKRKKRQTCSVKSDTMSTNKETGESIVQVNYREGNIQRILQHEIQKLITVSFFIFNNIYPSLKYIFYIFIFF